MRDRVSCLQTNNPIVRSVIAEFERGYELIERLDDVTYRRSANGTGSVGEHFRHNLDFANSFLNGMGQGRIDYSSRERDIQVETDRSYAIRKLSSAIHRMSGLADEMSEPAIYVRSEVDPATWLPSSIARELEFLNSHTVHHHALIAEKLAGFGIAVPENFGVASSTLEYWRAKAA